MPVESDGRNRWWTGQRTPDRLRRWIVADIPGRRMTTPLPVVTGSLANGVVTVLIDASSPLASSGGMALVQASGSALLVARTGLTPSQRFQRFARIRPARSPTSRTSSSSVPATAPSSTRTGKLCEVPLSLRFVRIRRSLRMAL